MSDLGRKSLSSFISPRKNHRSNSKSDKEKDKDRESPSDREKQRSQKIVIDRHLPRSKSKASSQDYKDSGNEDNHESALSASDSVLVEKKGSIHDSGGLEDEHLDSPRDEEPYIPIEDTPQNISHITTIQKYVRTYFWEIDLDRRVKWRVEREHIFQEIISTEETYVRGLTTLINDIYEPLASSMATDMIIEHNQFKSLFPEGQIRIIYTAHNDFLPRLRERKNTWSDHQAIGDIFLEMCKFLRLYTKYAEKYSEVDSTLEQLKKDKKFLHFLAQKWPDGTDHYSYLASLLITPIQRIPRYQMLLESLYKRTWTSHIDYVALGEALSDMKKTAKHVNDKAKEADNAKKLVTIDSSISGMKKSLVAANRKFIKEGFLVQKTEKNEWKKRYFFLFSDCLIRARPNRKQKGTYIFIEKVSLKKGTVSSLDKQEELEVEESQRPHSFEFKQPHPLRYVLVASSVEEKNDWMAAIQRALDDIYKTEQEHEEVAKKISVQKAHMAKNLIAASLLQHTSGGYRDRLNSAGGSPKNSQKSNTVDATNMRSFAEQLASSKMTTQEKWQQTKQAEPMVQHWEKEKQETEAKAKLHEALEKRVKQKEQEDKKKEIQKQLNSLGRGEVKSYKEAISQYKQQHGGKLEDPHQ